GRKKWTYPIAPILQPDWTKQRKLASAREVADDARKILAQARKNGCSGIKSTQAYFRDFDLTDISEDQAEEALKTLEKIKPYTYFENAVLFPVYKEPEAIRALKVYQDYLLRNIFMEAGKQNLVTVIHTAVAVHPALKPWLNDPVKLYSIFDNDDVRRAGTKFLLIHTGYPAHHIVSSLISQYPNVYVDLSHYSVDVSWLNAGILAEYLSLSSPTKVMHGTDTAHPDVTAFGAHNTRVGLAKYAEWLYEVEHWSDSEITDLAELVMYKNADKLFPN
ncbi:MAG: amidohydrolase family protein, partial [Nitrososphaerales archaeon]